MNKGDEWEESLCCDTWLHRYQIVAQYAECVMEVCEICGDEQYYQILPNGMSDNQEYLSHNIRMALPPFHPLFEHEYSEI
jgi:hypothetical protein